MMIIETRADFEQFLKELPLNEWFIIPIMSDTRAHPKVNSVCALYVFVPESNRSYFLPFRHNEAVNIPEEWVTEIGYLNYIYTPSKNTLAHLLPHFHNLTVDIRSVEYLKTGHYTDDDKFYTPMMRQMYGVHRNRPNLNNAVPLMTLLEYCEVYMAHLVSVMENVPVESLMYLNDVILDACWIMESGGVHVDDEKFVAHFGDKVKPYIKNGLVYTEYNPYTVAGRVSNKYGGVNYAALEKEHGTREAFTSRFEKGNMVLIDFESFHLRLIAELMNYKLPTEPVHEFLGKQYFQTDVLTPEQYEEGKKKTFAYLYSTRREGVQIEYFQKVYEYTDMIWEAMRQDGFLTSKKGRKVWLAHIENPSPAKVFNYMLQLHETEVAMGVIYQLGYLFDNKQSKITLYTYDSILIDFAQADGADFLREVVKVLEMDGRFPVRVYAGKSYGDLHNVTLMVKPNKQLFMD